MAHVTVFPLLYYQISLNVFKCVHDNDFSGCKHHHQLPIRNRFIKNNMLLFGINVISCNFSENAITDRIAELKQPTNISIEREIFWKRDSGS